MMRKLRRLPLKLVKPKDDEEEDFFHRPGDIPGTIIIDADAPAPIIFLIDYNKTDVVRKQLNTPEECAPDLD